LRENNRSPFTFFAILAYTIALFMLMGLIVGNLSFVDTWWLLLLLIAGGVAFTGTAIREAREGASNAIVPQSPLVEPPIPAAPQSKKETEPAPKTKKETKPAPKPTKPQPASPPKPDDLTKIEGIGPKMNQSLQAGGVDTFAKLAALSLDEIRAILDEQGTRFAPSAESWAEQAGFAAKGDWDGLAQLQDRLVGGRYPES
jgi:predicted flap endonuclease-1-like 5' DNA nuclease